LINGKKIELSEGGHYDDRPHLFFVSSQPWRSDMRNTRFTLVTFGNLLMSSVLVLPVPSFAQKRGTPGGSTSAKRDAIFEREVDIQSREIQLRMLNEGKTTTPQSRASAEDRKLIVNQIFEDFQRIQVVNREMMQLSPTLNSTSYRRMSNLAEEMGKRAKRLKINLGVPDAIQEKKEADSVPEMDLAQVQATLQTINPLFQDPRVTDVRHLANLRRDIFTLIDQSRAVKKAVGKLGNH
jgi:hypothetical protein